MLNNKFITTVFLIISLSALSSYGQYTASEDERPPLRERIFFGGSFGLQLGTVTNIEVSPITGIWLLPRLSAAAGPTYQYYKDPFEQTNIYGGRSFMRFMFIRDIGQFIPIGMRLGFYVHAEYEALSLRSDFWTGSYPDDSRFWIHSTLAGAGISQSLGPKSSLNITFMWNLTESQYQVYDKPEIRIDFIF